MWQEKRATCCKADAVVCCWSGVHYSHLERLLCVYVCPRAEPVLATQLGHVTTFSRNLPAGRVFALTIYQSQPFCVRSQCAKQAIRLNEKAPRPKRIQGMSGAHLRESVVRCAGFGLYRAVLETIRACSHETYQLRFPSLLPLCQKAVIPRKHVDLT